MERNVNVHFSVLQKEMSASFLFSCKLWHTSIEDRILLAMNLFIRTQHECFHSKNAVIAHKSTRIRVNKHLRLIRSFHRFQVFLQCNLHRFLVI